MASNSEILLSAGIKSLWHHSQETPSQTRGWRHSSEVLRALIFLLEYLGLVPSTHMAAHSSMGSDRFLTSLDTWLVSGTQIYMREKYSIHKTLKKQSHPHPNTHEYTYTRAVAWLTGLLEWKH